MFISLFLATALHASPMLPPPDQIQEVVVQNRVLTKVNEKTISVLDVMKRMDLFLSRYYPQYMDSKAMRYQYYTTQWRQTLQQMIDDELMVADAESREVKVTDGEVREEIQLRFGPNVMKTLDTIGISYEEARKLVQEEMIVQRMQWLRITSKALQKVTSQEVKKAYAEYLEKNPVKEEIKYQFVTIRAEKGSNLAERIKNLKEAAHDSLIAAVDLFKAQTAVDSATSITVSQEFDVDQKSLSQSHKDVLQQLGVGQWSAPTVQTSKDGSSVVRIFHLKDRSSTKPPAFEAIANELKQNLLNEAAQKESEAYLVRLHQRFGFDDSSLDIPPSFEPFTAR
jgi:hypothetical protein